MGVDLIESKGRRDVITQREPDGNCMYPRIKKLNFQHQGNSAKRLVRMED